MIVELSKDEVRVCSQLAIERWLGKWDSVDRPNYAQGKTNGKLEPELLAIIRANVCEWAVAKMYNIGWNVPWYPNELHPVRQHISDVGWQCEVRSVRTANAVPFWTKDLGKLLIAAKCLDEVKYSQVFVFGHLEPENYMQDVFYDEAIKGWRIPLEMFELADESTP